MKRFLALLHIIVLSAAAAFAQPTAGKSYHIVNVSNGLTLTNRQSRTHDAPITIVSENAQLWGQVWEVRRSSSGAYYFVNPYCEQAIDLNPNGNHLLQWEYSDNNKSGKNQRFYIKETEDGFQILNFEVPENQQQSVYPSRSRYVGYEGTTVKMLTAADATTTWRFVEVDRDAVMDPNQSTSSNIWENQAIFGRNKEEGHATFIPYPSRTAMEADAETFAKPWVTPAVDASYLSLCGRWKFLYAASPDERPGEADFYGDAVDASAWDDINVPGCWEMYGYDKPLYINVNYAFTDDPPYINNTVSGVDPNPVGSYRRSFELPEGWGDQRVFLHFDGLYSGALVWVNGREVGYTQGGNNDAEFDITDYVRAGANNICVQVIRWTDGSYLEGQDMWHMSGLHRDVYLYATPRTFIRDHAITATLDRSDYRSGEVSITLEVDNRDAHAATKSVQVSILSPEGDTVATLHESLTFAEGDASKTFSLRRQLSDLLPWTAETPYLYTFVFEQYDGASTEGNAEMAFSTKFGFRDISIANKQVLINGQRVFFRGVNTQDTHPVLGRSIDIPTMLRDITLMKQANVNTVRTSHYPRQTKMYAMFDYYGIYVMDEADVECHKNWTDNKNINNDASWQPQWLDRTKRMVLRDRNHPSVIFWSLGNESGDGSNLTASFNLVKELDASRIVHNCTGSSASPARISELHSIMYPSLSTLSSNLSSSSRPVFLCEYAHAMGNAVGNLKEYWDFIESSQNGIGGCIWDWVDQSIYAPTDVKDRLLAGFSDDAPLTIEGLNYISGYDMPDEQHHQGNFLNNGIVGPAREWNAKLAEVKKIYQPAAFSFHKETFSNEGVVTITSKLVFAELSERYYLQCESIDADGNVIGSRRYELTPTAPGSYCNVTVDADCAFLNVSLCLKTDATYAKAGYAATTEQFSVKGYAPAAAAPTCNDVLSVTTSGGYHVISAPRTQLVIGATDGFIKQFTSNGVNMLASDIQQPIYSNIRWIENESPYGNHNFGATSASISSASVSSPTLSADGTIATFTVTADDDQCPYVIAYSLTSAGALSMNVTYKPKASELRRIGMDMKFPAGFEQVTYSALGPWENYVDRHDAAYYGRYSTTVDDMYVDYIHPQSNGNHLGLRSLLLVNPTSGDTISVTSSTGTEFSLSHYRQAEFLQKTVHRQNLTRHDAVFATFDYMQRGLGNGSCGPGTESTYYCPSSGNFSQQLMFYGIHGNGSEQTPQPEPDAEGDIPEVGKVYNVSMKQAYGSPAPVYINDEGQQLGALGEESSNYGPAAMFLYCELDDCPAFVNLVTGRLLQYIPVRLTEDFIFTEVDDPRLPDNVPVINYDKATPLQRTDRYVTSIACGGQKITPSSDHRPYQDLRAQVVEANIGAELSTSVGWYNPKSPSSAWMHSYIYIDENHDGILSYDVDNSAKRVTGELRSFSCYSFGGDSKTYAVNSLGNTVDHSKSLNPPAFTAPGKPGDYVVRLKVDWDNLCPAGAVQGINESSNNGILQNGGCIIDFTLRVRPVENPDFSDVDADCLTDLDDVVALTRHLLGHTVAPNPDVNRDGVVSIGDLTALIVELQGK